MPATEAPATPSRVSRLAGWWGAAALVLVCVLAYLPGLFTIPPVDRDESRFAQASKQMATSSETRDWVVPMVGDTPRLNKPPVIYWLQALSARAGGVTPGDATAAGTVLREPDASQTRIGGIGWYRVPSALAAIVGALGTWRLGISMFGVRHARTAWLGGLLLATSLIVMWEARQARADQVLLAVTTAAMLALWHCWSASRTSRVIPLAWSLALWVCVGVGVMVKGPITPMIAALTAVALSAATGRWRWLWALRPVLGLAVVLACGLPWVMLVGREVGWERYLSIIHDEVLGRSVSPAEGHWGPPGYHLVLLPLMFWPGSLLTAAGVVLAWKSARRARTPSDLRGVARLRGWLARFTDERPADLFLLAWLLPAWTVFELVSTKLPHYTMPLYPAVALLSARAVATSASSVDAPAAMGLRTLGARLGMAVWVVLGVAVAVAAPLVIARAMDASLFRSTMLLLGGLVGASAGGLLVAAMALWRGQFARAQSFGVLVMIASAWVTFGAVLPGSGALWTSSRIAQVIASVDGPPGVAVGAVGYHEDSLKFLTGGRLDRLGMPGLPAWLDANEGGVLVLPAGTRDANAELAGRTEQLGRVRGFNYSKGKWVDLEIVRCVRRSQNAAP